ncbi:MAG: hypothetical protein K1X29_08885 [Bdellovibrionales bacterium]|nr:hypothetical protein [Bdellovibrionales bacterium]
MSKELNDSETAEKLAQEFISQSHLYKLGGLPTEARHGKTMELSHWAHADLSKAVNLLQEVDCDALDLSPNYEQKITLISKAIQKTLVAGKKVFICGCGATGRLALCLEYLWRKNELHSSSENRKKNENYLNRVVAFMAGGDVALVHSLEGFEDHADYGARQLKELGYTPEDTLIAVTEGGETPFVIGAAEWAAQQAISRDQVFFLFCNPKDLLQKTVSRSERVFQNSKIKSLSFYVGPMALSGSTRMQASTILEMALGVAFSFWQNPSGIRRWLEVFVSFYKALDFRPFVDLILEEANTYTNNNYIIYSVGDLGVTVFTDTTERSPTFSLPPFNNQYLERPLHSLSYIMFPGALTTESAWTQLLHRSPRVLNWPEINNKTSLDYLYGFDFSHKALTYRKRVLPHSSHALFSIDYSSLLKNKIRFRINSYDLTLPLPDLGVLSHHLILKMYLNIHSTLVMGRLNRYTSNVMTYVNPTNGKLIDRALRYIQWILNDHLQIKNKTEGLKNFTSGIEDRRVLIELFKQIKLLKSNESVVLKTVEALKSKI